MNHSRNALKHALPVLFHVSCMDEQPESLRFKAVDTPLERELTLHFDHKTIHFVLEGRHGLLEKGQETEVGTLLARLCQSPALASLTRASGMIVLHNAEPRWINVPMLSYHSTDRTPQAGYAGSGPADTALSILSFLRPVDGPRDATELRAQLGLPEESDREEAYLESLSDEEHEVIDDRFWQAYQALPVKLRGGDHASQAAWKLHHDFVRAALESAPESLVCYPVAEIEAWVTRRLTAPDGPPEALLSKHGLLSEETVTTIPPEPDAHEMVALLRQLADDIEAGRITLTAGRYRQASNLNDPQRRQGDLHLTWGRPQELH